MALLVVLLLAPAAAAGDPLPHLRDEVSLFEHDLVTTMEKRLVELASDTGFEIILQVRAFEGFDEFTPTAEVLFEEVVRDLGHYRVALVLIGIDRTSGRGMVGTNLGAGLFQVMSREQVADLFLAEGEAFSPERIALGVDRLASKLEEYHSLRAAAGNKDLFPSETQAWHQRFGVRFYPVVVLVLLGLWFGWSAWRSRICPRCGAAMRTRVRLGGPGGAAVRTAKCFECGHVQKRRWEAGGRRWPSRGSNRSRGTPEA